MDSQTVAQMKDSSPLGLLLLAVFVPLLVSHVLQLAFQRSTHRDNQGAWVMGIYPLLDLCQP